MPPRRSLPPLEFWRGTRPIHAARFLPDLNVVGSGIVATKALASNGPIPGIAISLRPMSVARALDRIRRSFSRNLFIHQPQLRCHHLQANPRLGGNAIILFIVNDADQPL